MTTRNAGSASVVKQRIVGSELACFFLQHHRYAVMDGIGEPVQTAHQHLRLALETQCSLAYRASENFQQPAIHLSYHPSGAAPVIFPNTRASSSCASPSLKYAVTGTYHRRALANCAHLTASFSVMSTGRSSANSSSEARNA